LRFVNQEYHITVALPASYPAQPTARYPTIYLLDANWYFGMVTDITRIMARCETFPETIVVGIGYPVDEPLDDAFKQIWASRQRDFTPTVDHEEEREDQEFAQRPVTTGGAPHFLQFIREELIPFIEDEYRTDGDQRVLVGHSSGGLFALYTLFHAPNLFRSYIVGSPYLNHGMKQHGERIIFTYEQRFAAHHRQLPVNLYLAIGEHEGSGYPAHMYLRELSDQLRARGYEGFALTVQTHPNCDHCQSVAPAFQAGLLTVCPMPDAAAKG